MKNYNSVVIEMHKPSEIAHLLISSGVSVTTQCLLYAARNRDMDMVKIAIEQLKSTDKWDTTNSDVIAALEATLESQESYSVTIANLLISSGVSLTTKCFLSALQTRDLDMAKTALEQLKSSDKWNAEDPVIIAALEATFVGKEHPHDLGNYSSTAHFLISSRVPVTTKCFLSAVRAGNRDMVKTAITELKLARKWDPQDPVIREALEATFAEQHNILVNNLAHILISSGVSITINCLLSATASCNTNMVRTAIEELRTANKWDPNSPVIIAALEATFKHKYQKEQSVDTKNLKTPFSDPYSTNIYPKYTPVHLPGLTITRQNPLPSPQYTPFSTAHLLISSGVPVTTKCLVSAITNEDKELAQLSIQNLKAAGNQGLVDENITVATTELLKYDPLHAMRQGVFKGLLELLQCLGVPVTYEAMLLAVDHDDTNFIKTAIPNWERANSQEIAVILEKAWKKDMYEVVELLSMKQTHKFQQLKESISDINQTVLDTQQFKQTVENLPSSIRTMELQLSHLHKDIENLKCFLTEVKSTELQLGQLLTNHLNAELLEQSSVILEHICSVLRGKDCVSIYPAYKPKERWKPIIVKLENTFMPGRWDKCVGIDTFIRRYDEVSQEASMVMNDPEVQNNLPRMEDMQRIRKAIKSADLTKKHSNITLISSCPYKSRNGGKELEKCLCIVIHCLVKGLIPFGEKPFPEEIDGIPTDVREGYCVFGMRSPDDDGDFPMEDMHHLPPVPLSQAMALTTPSNLQQQPVTINPTATSPLPIGDKSSEYNSKLLIGTGICPSLSGGKGTLGGFVKYKDQDQSTHIGLLTCAHVVVPDVQPTTNTGQPPGNTAYVPSPVLKLSNQQTKVSQPAHDDVQTPCNLQTFECGELVKYLFDPGSLDRVGIDAAVVKITDTNRLPTNGAFIFVNKAQTRFAGFDPASPPNFDSGKFIPLDQLTDEQKQMLVLKYGSQTGLTIGHVHQNGTYGRQVTKEMQLQDGRRYDFYDQVEILSLAGPSTSFFELGDSGSLVFLKLSTGLHCVGMAIGVTNYKSCLVTPIEDVLERLGVELVDFTRR